MANSDVVIVGGGVIGCAVAYFLVTDPAFDGSVTIVERDPSYETASTSLSASSLRLQFSTPENVAMSAYGVEFLAGARERFAADDIDVELAIEPCPYLTLAAPAELPPGVEVELLDGDELARRYPWMDVADVTSAVLGPPQEGLFDGVGLHDALRRAALRRGAELVVGEVTDLVVRDDRVAEVVLGDGRRLSCGSVVDAAGPHARAVARMAGAELPVSPRKRCLFVFRTPNPPRRCPIVVDPVNGIAFRPEGDQFLTTLSRLPEGRDPETVDLRVESDLFEEHLWPALATRVPSFDELRLTTAWAGLYEINPHDHNAIIGPHPEIGNLLFANGFSGHGLQHAPAAGRAVAELIVAGAFRTLDLGALGYERLLREGHAEVQVI